MKAFGLLVCTACSMMAPQSHAGDFVTSMVVGVPVSASTSSVTGAMVGGMLADEDCEWCLEAKGANVEHLGVNTILHSSKEAPIEIQWKNMPKLELSTWNGEVGKNGLKIQEDGVHVIMSKSYGSVKVLYEDGYIAWRKEAEDFERAKGQALLITLEVLGGLGLLSMAGASLRSRFNF